MGLRDSLMRVVVGLFFERPARKKSLDELAATLEQSGAKLEQRFAGAAETDVNRAQLSHIVGIERWAQQRLRVGLGAPPSQDEYDGYQPEATLDWAGLRTAFKSARQETVALARALVEAGTDGAKLVAHNQFGPISLRAWLNYMNTHANFEARRIR